LAVLALLATGCAKTFSAGAAVVNGTAISKAQLAAAVKSGAQNGQPSQPTTLDGERTALQQLIATELIRQAADKRHLAATPAQVAKQLSDIKASFPDPATYQSQLKQAGFTEATLIERIGDSLTRTALVKALTQPVTAAQIKLVYDSQLATYKQVSTKHILIAVDAKHTDAEAKSLATQLLTRLKGGEDFAALAKKYSADPGSKDKGGKIGYFAVSGLDPSYAQAAEKAKIGALVGPIRSQFGWHIIVTLGKRTQPLSEVKAQLRQQLESQISDSTMQDFLQAQLATADVEVNPRYGDWDPATGQIVEHKGFVPASPPALDQTIPSQGGIPLTPTGQ